MDGIICIYKEQGFTSFDVVAKLRGILKTRKIGHAGTLDPMATGVLPVFVGRATGACDYLSDHDKVYRATFRLGTTTDTLDITGTVLSTQPVCCTAQDVREAAQQFVGEIMQVPPMYSAVKIGGRKLYQLAREGKKIERIARPVTIYSLTMIQQDEEKQEYTIEVACSKGTYIRSLCDDIGKQLGCGAVMTALERVAACGFRKEQSHTLQEIEQIIRQGEEASLYTSVEQAFLNYPAVRLDQKQTNLLYNGVKLDCTRVEIPTKGPFYRTYSAQGEFIALCYIDEEQCFRSKKFFVLKDCLSEGR